MDHIPWFGFWRIFHGPQQQQQQPPVVRSGPHTVATTTANDKQWTSIPWFWPRAGPGPPWSTPRHSWRDGHCRRWPAAGHRWSERRAKRRWRHDNCCGLSGAKRRRFSSFWAKGDTTQYGDKQQRFLETAVSFSLKVDLLFYWVKLKESIHNM